MFCVCDLKPCALLHSTAVTESVRSFPSASLPASFTMNATSYHSFVTSVRLLK